MTSCLPCVLAKGGAGETVVVTVVAMDAEPAPSLLTVAVAMGGGGVAAADAVAVAMGGGHVQMRTCVESDDGRGRVDACGRSSAERHGHASCAVASRSAVAPASAHAPSIALSEKMTTGRGLILCP